MEYTYCGDKMQIEEKIKEVLQKIRPYLNQDGGDVEFVKYEDGIAYVNLLGEIVDNKFVFGVIRKPSFASTVKIISKEKNKLWHAA